MRKKLIAYFHRVGRARIIASLLGNVLVALGIALFKQSSLGNDPFTGMNMAMADVLRISFPVYQLCVNGVLFLIQFLAGRKLIGFGTLVNAFLVGSMVSFFFRLSSGWFGMPETFLFRVLVMLIGMAVCSFGLSMYQTADLGVSPYDSMALILDRRFSRIPYFWCRIFTDGLCALVCFLAGGIIGLGTVVTAFGFGPVIAFFNRFVPRLFRLDDG